MKSVVKVLLLFLVFWSFQSLASPNSIDAERFEREQNLRAKCQLALLLSDFYFSHKVDSADFVIRELIKHQDDSVYADLVKSTILFIDGKNTIINKGDVPLARRKLFVARNYFFSQQEIELVVVSNMAIGNSYYIEGKFEKSIQFYQRALNLAVKLEESPEYLESLFGIGRSYIELGDTVKGLDFLKEYTDITVKNKFQRSYAKVLAYEAMIHFDTGDIETARLMYQKSVDIALQSNLREEYADGLTNQAIHFYLTEMFDSAEVYFEKALREREEIGAIKPIIESNFNLGSFYLGQENYSKSLTYFLTSKKLANEYGYWLDEKDVNEELIQLNKTYPLSRSLWQKIEKDQKRLEKQVSTKEKLHDDLNRQMEHWLKSGGINTKKIEERKELIARWGVLGGLFLVILTGTWLLKKNW